MNQREILFRGKDQNGNWVEGDYSKTVRNNDVIHIITWIEANKNPLPPNALEESPMGEPILGVGFNEILPETLGQYTFHTYWKAGKEVKIFTGDMAQFIFKNELVIGVVKQAISGAFYLDCGNLDDPSNMKIWWVTQYVDLKWVGNIHDNPESITSPEAGATEEE